MKHVGPCYLVWEDKGIWSAVSPIGKYQLPYFEILYSKWRLGSNVRSVNNRPSIKAGRESYGSEVSPKVKVTARYDFNRMSLGFRALYMSNSWRSYCELHIKFNFITHYRRRDGGTSSTLRIKEQGTYLTLHEHDDDYYSLLRLSYQWGYDGCGVRLAYGKTVIHIRLWLENLRKTDGVGGLGVDVEIILKGIFKNIMVRCGMDSSGTW